MPLSPWKQPAVCQAKDATARVHCETLRWEGHLPGARLFVSLILFSPLMQELKLSVNQISSLRASVSLDPTSFLTYHL